MFSVYNKMYGGVELAQYYKEDLTLDENLLIQNLNSEVKMVVISNPGHTGKSIDEALLIKIVEKAEKNNILVVIDEAYYHFCDTTMIDHINNYKNLIISRTFSKAIGLASLRIGLLIGHRDLINELYRVKLVHEITGLAAKIGSYIIDNFEIVDNYVEEVNQGKKILIERLSKINIEIFQSDSNLFFFKMPIETDIEDFMIFLQEKNIYIKGPFLTSPFKGQMRLTVGNTEQMNMFCDVVFDYFNK
jgi:histidinol-phosphate aminotransferase